MRKAIGARLDGHTCHSAGAVDLHPRARAPDLIPGRRAWMYLSLNPRRCGTTIAIDGHQTWLIHNFSIEESRISNRSIATGPSEPILGVGSDFVYEVISKKDWYACRLVADRFRDRRVFLCGDAAHLWTPHAGYGMNAGIADAANLSWLMAATLNGWASPSILDAYEAERRPIAEQVSISLTDLALRSCEHRRSTYPGNRIAPGP